MKTTTRLRKLVESGKTIAAPGAHDPVTAKLIEREGFPALYLTGGGTTNARTGLPEIGLSSMTDRVEVARAIAGAVDIPVICDADDGYGGAVSVVRTVRALEDANVAAIHLEDQMPGKRRCGYMSGGELLPIAEMAGKIRAAVDARRDPDLMIIARVEALMTSGMDEVIARGRAYSNAGADMLFINGLTTMEQVERIARAFDKPQLFNVSSSGATPFIPLEQLEALGFRIAIYPVFCLFAAVWNMRQLLSELKRTGSVSGFRDRMIDFAELNDLLGLPKYLDQQARYELS